MQLPDDTRYNNDYRSPSALEPRPIQRCCICDGGLYHDDKALRLDEEHYCMACANELVVTLHGD